MLLNAEYHQHRSGLFLPYKKRKPTAIDFFCGAGGISLGFIQAGFEVVAAIDYDEIALTTYMINLGSYPINIHYIDQSDKDRLNKYIERLMKHKKGEITKALTSGSGWIRNNPDASPVKNVWMGDVRKLSGKQILDELGMEPGEVDCVAGGPPCQGFSSAGKREVMDPRNSLIFEYARLILEIQPKTFMMENVPGILTMVTPEGIPVVDAFCKVMAEGGFGSYEALKKTLLTTAGAGVALKGQQKVSKKKRPEAETVAEEPEPQLTMF